MFEVRLGDEFLMSSLLTVARIELAQLGLWASVGHNLDVLVGGLGLGYTAQAALDDVRVRRVPSACSRSGPTTHPTMSS